MDIELAFSGIRNEEEGILASFRGDPVNNKTFEQQQDDNWDRMCAAEQANLARYVFDETGQCRGRCTEHDQGVHHRLCSDSAESVAERARGQDISSAI